MLGFMPKAVVTWFQRQPLRDVRASHEAVLRKMDLEAKFADVELKQANDRKRERQQIAEQSTRKRRRKVP